MLALSFHYEIPRNGMESPRSYLETPNVAYRDEIGKILSVEYIPLCRLSDLMSQNPHFAVCKGIILLVMLSSSRCRATSPEERKAGREG